MVSILTAAGLPKNVLDAVEGVTDTCRICRLWHKPSHRAQATLRLSTEFNAVIQIDLLFLASLIVLHIIDECTRWTSCVVIESKLACDVLSGLVQGWFRLFGPPRVVIADHEGALVSEEGSIFFERWGTSFSPKPVGSHAQIVERHHEIVRQTFHRVKSQAQAENLMISDKDIVAETVFAKTR